VYRRVRHIPLPERDRPNMQAVVVSPGWRGMTLEFRYPHDLRFEATAVMDLAEVRELARLYGKAREKTWVRNS